VVYHLFGVWHGDRRLQARYGEAFEILKHRTSVIPFWAVVQKQQTLDLREFIRPAYLGVTAFVFLTWWAHPFLIRASSSIAW